MLAMYDFRRGKTYRPGDWEVFRDGTGIGGKRDREADPEMHENQKELRIKEESLYIGYTGTQGMSLQGYP